MTQKPPQELQLTDLLDVATLQEILDVFAAVTRASVSLCDPQGRLILRPSGTNAFCRLLLDTEDGRASCRESHREAVRRAVEQRECVPTRCHAGMTQYAAPILLEEEVLAVIVMGDMPNRLPDAEQLDRLAHRFGIDRDAFDAVHQNAPAFTEEQMTSAVSLLQLLANTLARFCQQEDRLRRRVDELVTLYDITSALTGPGDLEEALRLTAANVAKVLPVKACSIRLLDRSTNELRIAAGYNLSGKYLSKGPVRVEENPIDKAALEGKIVYIADVGDDDRIRYPAQAREEGLVSGLVAGMIFREEPVGVIRVYTGQRHAFTAFETSLLRAVASQVAASIENKRLTEEAIEAEVVNRQIQSAAEVQRRMLPEHPPEHRALDFGTVYEPTQGLAGDFFDFLQLPDGLLGLSIADVVGKGVAASLLMASVRSALRVWARGLGPVEEIIRRVNGELYRDTLAHEFATLFYGVFTPNGRELTYCSAGHEPPLLVRDGEITRLETGGMLIGTIPDAKYEQGKVELRPNDLLLFYTDGVVDAMNFAGETFGRGRLADSLIRYAGLRAEVIAPNILWDVRRFAGLVNQIDDITMVSVKVKG